MYWLIRSIALGIVIVTLNTFAVRAEYDREPVWRSFQRPATDIELQAKELVDRWRLDYIEMRLLLQKHGSIEKVISECHKKKSKWVRILDLKEYRLMKYGDFLFRPLDYQIGSKYTDSDPFVRFDWELAWDLKDTWYSLAEGDRFAIIDKFFDSTYKWAKINLERFFHCYDCPRDWKEDFIRLSVQIESNVEPNRTWYYYAGKKTRKTHSFDDWCSYKFKMNLRDRP